MGGELCVEYSYWKWERARANHRSISHPCRLNARANHPHLLLNWIITRAFIIIHFCGRTRWWWLCESQSDNWWAGPVCILSHLLDSSRHSWPLVSVAAPFDWDLNSFNLTAWKASKKLLITSSLSVSHPAYLSPAQNRLILCANLIFFLSRSLRSMTGECPEWAIKRWGWCWSNFHLRPMTAGFERDPLPSIGELSSFFIRLTSTVTFSLNARTLWKQLTFCGFCN